MTTENVFLIGGSGFIGQYLTRDLINAGARVTMADLKPPTKDFGAKFVQLDLCNQTALAQALPGHTTICNLAAAHRDDIRPISLYTTVNVDGAQRICDAAAQAGIDRIVFTSSVAVYGTQATPPDENAPHLATHPYGQTKSQAEAVYQRWQANAPGRLLNIVRPTVVFGPGNRGNVHTLIDQIARGRFVMVGDGRNRKSMAYVENVSAYLAHVILQQRLVNTIANYIDKPDLDMNKLVALLAHELGKPVPRARLPYALGLVAGTGFDLLARVTGRSLPISKLRVEKFCAETVFEAPEVVRSGFRAPFTLAEGLARTLSYEYAQAPQSQAQAAE